MSSIVQPRHNVDINTVITVGDVEYSVVGTAVVGNYDGRIYNCNVSWIMQIERADGMVDFTMRLIATLKPEFNQMFEVEPVMENYIITVTNPNMVPAESIHNLWVSIVDICNASVDPDVVLDEDNLSVYEYIKYYASAEEITFLQETPIIDNTPIVRAFLNNRSIVEMQMAAEVDEKIRIIWGRHRIPECETPIGVCVIIDLACPIDFNGILTPFHDKIILSPTISYHGSTFKEGYLPLFYDIRVNDDITLKAGIYKVYPDNTNRYCVAIDKY